MFKIYHFFTNNCAELFCASPCIDANCKFQGPIDCRSSLYGVLPASGVLLDLIFDIEVGLSFKIVKGTVVCENEVRSLPPHPSRLILPPSADSTLDQL